VIDVQPSLRDKFDLATKKYSDDYKYILFALASSNATQTKSSDIWEKYLELVSSKDIDQINRNQFNNRMGRLKTEAHGSVLQGTRQGWYRFANPMLRGYCRLVSDKMGFKKNDYVGI
jgi:uncharacterized protein